MTEILISDLTDGTVGGAGVYDKLMSAMKAHLDVEFTKNRITGPNYSTVYLGALDNVMSSSMQFLIQKKAVGLQADLLEQQILLAQIEVQKAQIALRIAAIEESKAGAELLQIQAQTAMVAQQTANLIKEQDKTAAEIVQMGAQTAMVKQQTTNAIAEGLNIPKQGLMIDAQAAQAKQQTTNLVSQELQIKAQTALVTTQQLTEVIQGRVLEAQICKLQAEFDLTVSTVTKTTQEIALLSQKTATEKAQTQSIGVDDDSVIGKQKKLYTAQTEGFARDAEQKAASLLVQTWSVRRTSDEGTVADGTNMLNDATIGRVVQKVLSGVGA